MKSGFIRRIPARTSPIGTHGQLQEPETGANDAPASMSSTSGLACWLGGFPTRYSGRRYRAGNCRQASYGGPIRFHLTVEFAKRSVEKCARDGPRPLQRQLITNLAAGPRCLKAAATFPLSLLKARACGTLCDESPNSSSCVNGMAYGSTTPFSSV